MSFARSVLFLCLASLAAMFGFLFFGSAAGYDEYRSGYAVLTFNSEIEDRDIRELLDAGKDKFAGSPVSESSLWVLLDEFDTLNVIPLDVYSKRVLPFDPRNDGYAQKLKDIFIHNDKRFVFIPLKTGSWAQTFLDRQFSDLLGDISFSTGYFGIGKPLSLFFMAFTAASAALLVICYAKKRIHPGVIGIIPLIPVLFSFAFFGAPGIAAAALLVGFAVMLREPLNEFILLNMNNKNSVQRKKTFRKNIAEPYMLNLFLFPVFAAAIGVLVVFTELNLLFVAAVFVAACALFLFSIKTISLKGGSHRRFTPVLISRRRSINFSFSVYMLPFAIAAFAVMFITPNMSGNYTYDGKLDHINLIDEQDYYAHLIYQSSFSMQQMGISTTSYPYYMFDKDGLPIPDLNRVSDTAVDINEYPPFPLKHLMEFIDNVNNSGTVNKIGHNNQGITGNISLFILLLFIIPGLFSGKFFNDRINFMPKGRFAALKRSSGALHGRKTLFYAAPSQKSGGGHAVHAESSYSRIQRDA